MLITDMAKALGKHKVEYAIVGGYAVALHGAVRGTVDIDIVIKISEKSFVDTEAALKSIGLTSRLPVSAHEVFQFREEYIKNRNLIAWSFYDTKNPSNVIDIIITSDLNKLNIVTKKVNGIDLKLISIADLIKMKKSSGRPQDLADVEALVRIK